MRLRLCLELQLENSVEFKVGARIEKKGLGGISCSD